MQDRPRAMVDLPAPPEDHGVDLPGGLLPEQAGCGFALERGKVEPLILVGPEEEVHGPVAESAHAVKEDDGEIFGVHGQADYRVFRFEMVSKIAVIMR